MEEKVREEEKKEKRKEISCKGKTSSKAKRR
jgi:hypothetical protein